MSLYNKGLSPIPDREGAPIVPQDVAYRWRFERDEAWMASRQYREQRDMARNEVDRLRARVAELETAGDEQIRRVEHVSEQINAQHEFLSEILDDVVHEWRAVRGER